tara:strand:- start:155 stop:628 length:474 start_codon:yes stop_codon:yes gene_type:complete
MNKYNMYAVKRINGTAQKITFDVYDILNNFKGMSEEVKHTVKKLLRPDGSTGSKSRSQDIQECINQLQMEQERIKLLEEWTASQKELVKGAKVFLRKKSNLTDQDYNDWAQAHEKLPVKYLGQVYDAHQLKYQASKDLYTIDGKSLAPIVWKFKNEK